MVSLFIDCICRKIEISPHYGTEPIVTDIENCLYYSNSPLLFCVHFQSYFHPHHCDRHFQPASIWSCSSTISWTTICFGYFRFRRQVSTMTQHFRRFLRCNRLFRLRGQRLSTVWDRSIGHEMISRLIWTWTEMINNQMVNKAQSNPVLSHKMNRWKVFILPLLNVTSFIVSLFQLEAWSICLMKVAKCLTWRMLIFS